MTQITRADLHRIIDETRADLHRLLDEVVAQEKRARASAAWIHGASWVIGRLPEEQASALIDEMVALRPSKESYIRAIHPSKDSVIKIIQIQRRKHDTVSPKEPD
jgi:hypothetical protein